MNRSEGIIAWPHLPGMKLNLPDVYFHPMIIIGHRGARALEPENTLLALQKGMECAEYVEIDVRMSRDGKLVVIHDPTLERTTNGRGLVKDHTFEELQKLDAGKGERIPSLDEVMRLVSGRSGLFVEIKEPGTEVEIAERIRVWRLEKLYFVSFHEQSITAIREAIPGAKTGLIYSRESPDILDIAKNLGADAILPSLKLASTPLVNEAHTRGMIVIPWTLNTLQDFEKSVAIGADGLASDDPCAARDFFSRQR